MTVAWTCNANNQFLQVHNASPTNVISQYDYTYDAAGRRIEVSKSGFAFTQDDTIAYGYNNRSELTNAVAAVDSDYRYDYDFDDIGNRETSSERGTNSVYTANNLNQYTLVGRVVPNAPQEEFIPQFDNDGNQTLVKTATGVWSVTYNGENRPVLWTLINSSTPNSSTPTLISMSYDRMGRRVAKNDQRFVYNGYLQIANFEHQTSNLKLQTFIWDPTEKIATRPLVWNFSTLQPFNFSTSYYTHDGNKNVSEVVAENGNIAAHYEYAPFGAVSTQCGAAAESNPWRFSSEYAEDETSTIYYNYRHYEPVIGKWLSRDPIEEDGGIINIYSYLDNTFGLYSDWIGQFPILPIFQAAFTSALKDAAKSFIISALTSWYDIGLDNGKLVYDAMMSCVNGDFDFHPINLYRPRDTSSLVKGFREALKDGFSSFITEALTGSLSEIIRGHASDFLKADPKSAYYEYFKKIEKFMQKDGVEELTDEMVKAISELAIIKVTDLSSLINSIDIVSDDEQMVKWTVKDKCRMCAIVEESYTVTMTIMGEKQNSFVVPGPKTERCFDYDEIKSRGPVGREIISGCSLCPCKKK